MSKVITNENQLNTEVDDLVTENYALEVLGLKNPADFRKFSRSFMKLSKIVKGIDDSNVGKLDKGAVSSEYDTAKKIEDNIKTAQSTADNKLPKGSLPVTVPDGKTIYDLLENNGGINIDTALLYLNDAGTKTAGKVYFDKNKKGLFECIKTTTNTVNSTEFFVDISNKASADRLTNLNDIKLIFNNTQGAVETGILNLNDSIENFKFIQIIYQFGGSISNPEGFLSDLYPVSFLKQNYNKGIIRGNSTYEKTVIFAEHLYFCFRNKNQIEILENLSSTPTAISNNRIYQIYAWN